MSNWKLRSPVVLQIFNRPQETRRVFDVVAQAKPSKLLVIADGPRTTIPDDLEKCRQTREIIDSINWDCELITNYADANMGSYQRNRSGLTWAFSLVEEAIILEDDCVPDLSFFRFCDELLEKYRHDERIFVISGSNFLQRIDSLETSYYYSRYPFMWGWASWRRVWNGIDFDMTDWPEFRENKGLKSIFSNKAMASYWNRLFQSIYCGEMKTAWDYQLMLRSFMKSGISIVPKSNLVTNIGHGHDATHVKNENAPYMKLKKYETIFPLVSPGCIEVSDELDKKTHGIRFPHRSLKARILNKIKKIIAVK